MSQQTGCKLTIADLLSLVASGELSLYANIVVEGLDSSLVTPTIKKGFAYRDNTGILVEDNGDHTSLVPYILLR